VTASELHARVSERETAEVMGLRLVPFTLGHARLLDHLGCDQLKDAGDVALTAIVCSRPQHKVMGFLRSWLMPLRLRVWKKYLGAWDAQLAADTLDTYLKRHTELPVVTRPERPDGSRCPVPHHQILRVILLRRLGYGPHQIDDTLYLQASWDVETLSVLEGRASMLDMCKDTFDHLDDGIDWDAVDKAAAAIHSRALTA
jgi:hypothetical protein